MQQQIIIPRMDRRETTIAVVQWAGPSRMQFAGALKRALTAWAKGSPRGRQEWEISAHDFNIGDLSSVGAGNLVGHASLGPFLSAAGFSHLTVECYCDPDRAVGLTYDTVLIDDPDE